MTTQQRIAIVTGANRGIGNQIATDLAALGMCVVLTARDAAKASAAASRIDGDVIAYPLDVTDAESIDDLKKFVVRELGRCDVLVNNAAIYIDGGASILNVDMDTVRATVETNVYGPLLLCQAFVPLMLEHNYGRVVNVSSEAGRMTSMASSTPSYNLSKTALNALTLMFAQTTRRKNVLINCMCPGWVRSDMGGPSAPRSLEEGADTAVWLATLPDDGPNGGFFRDRKPMDW
jgi:NAD(P)-dependent dehydrogenase (short-subunit alcohol dehydrogenase family)